MDLMPCLSRGRRCVIFLLLALAVLVLFPRAVHAQTVAVPPAYQSIYTLDQNYLDNFNSTLTASGISPAYSGMQCGSLRAADSNAGPSLLNSDPTQQLNELKALGVPCIEIHVSFPLLYEPFMTGQGQSMSAFQSFYSNLASQVRSMGLKLVVESTVLFTSGMTSQAGWNTAPFYATLNWTTYQQARAQTALTIAQTMQPDYMVVLEEPDTEAENSGQANVNTPSGANALLSTILAGMQAERQTGMKIGAGVGTWLPGFQPFIQGFVTQPMDFLDFHIYPVNDAYLPNALTIASMAGAAGLPVSMTEDWMHKELDSEVPVLTPDEVSSRDVFSFWAPLDQYFLGTMRTMAGYIRTNYKNSFLFMTPYEPDYFFVYQTYNSATEAMTPAELLSTESSLTVEANENAEYSNTGMSFYASNLSAPDSAPPTEPAGLSGSSGNPNTALLTWNESSDNVGVAGYNILRNGSVVATTSQLEPGILPVTVFYQDSGLTQATTYTYNIQAFDLAGNLSPLSQSVSVKTLDVTPPTAPANVAATASSCQKVILSWSPSTDNVGVNSYLVFWGTSPGNMAQSGRTSGTTTTYTSYPLTAGTTYYFGVEAADKAGNVSPMSSIVAVTTPKAPPVPAGLSASTPAATKVILNWSVAASGGLPIQYYLVFRGSSAASLAQIANPAQNTYVDVSVNPNTTYYYGVETVDSGGDVSLMSTVLHVTTPALPPEPPNVVATPVSTSKISLTWTPVNSVVPILCYHVFRGVSPAAMTEVGNTTKAPYTDISLSPATKYYYAVQAVDTGGDLSPMSATVSATTFALPSAPVNLLAQAASKTQVNLTWSAGSSGMPLASFQIFRGSSLTTLALLKQTAASSMSATDYPLTPGTTYYYGIQETDTAGNISPMSKTVMVTTPSN
jgi:fibronectin type 3 domain-containing protein